jgi:hypothetical protein
LNPGFLGGVFSYEASKVAGTSGDPKAKVFEIGLGRFSIVLFHNENVFLWFRKIPKFGSLFL